MPAHSPDRRNPMPASTISPAGSNGHATTQSLSCESAPIYHIGVAIAAPTTQEGQLSSDSNWGTGAEKSREPFQPGPDVVAVLVELRRGQRIVRRGLREVDWVPQSWPGRLARPHGDARVHPDPLGTGNAAVN